MVVTPYTETIEGSKRIRTFSNTVDSDELVWHRDRQNRTVTVLEGADWKFQMDNQLPQKLNPGDVVYIPKETYHRIIAGNSDLVIRIEEEQNDK